MLRRLIREDIRLEIDTAADAPAVRVDVGQIEQVLVNLVVNAADAMPDGGRLCIATATREVGDGFVAGHAGARRGRFAEITVSDTGTGMTPDIVAQIFEPFFTTKPKGQGTGLGLSVVYGIVKQSDGFIWAKSGPGQGTTFTILLPETDGVSDRDAPMPLVHPPTSRRARILVVDDDPGVAQLVAKVLRRRGHDVRQARSAAEAERHCAAWDNRVDLIVTDVVMPDESGYDLAARLTRQCPGSRAVLMSGYDNVRARRSGVATVAERFLPKPFDPATLADLVGDLLAPLTEVER